MLKNKRRLGEALFILTGIAIAIGGTIASVTPLSYAGLAITGLGLFSVFWR